MKCLKGMKGMVTAITLVVLGCLTQSVSVMADQPADALSKVTLSNGQEVTVNENPYGEGLTRLEYKVLEKMKQAAIDLGVDVTTDKTYQEIEQIKYERFVEEPRDAMQIDFGLKLVDEVKDKFAKVFEEKKQELPGETLSEGALEQAEVITSGAFTGFTDDEKMKTLIDIFTTYVNNQEEKIKLSDPNWGYGGIPAVYYPRTFFKYNVKVGNIKGDNYFVRDFYDKSTDEENNFKQKLKSYLTEKEGQFSTFDVARFKTYPQDAHLIGSVQIAIDTDYVETSYYDQQDACRYYDSSDYGVYHMKEDGSIEEIPCDITKITDWKCRFCFQVDELGYYAWGLKTEQMRQTPSPTETITPTEGIVATEELTGTSLLSDSNQQTKNTKTSPKTGDNSPIVLLCGCMLIAALGVQFGLRGENA